MNRRGFLLGLGGAGALTLLPVNLLNKVSVKLLSYTEPIYTDLSAMVGVTNGYLHQFNRMVTRSVCNMDCTCIRAISIVKAADNVSQQDIVNEIYSKYDDDKAVITTSAAEGDYGLDNGTFRNHHTIGFLKDHVKRMREHQLAQVGKFHEHNLPKHGKITYSVSRDGDYMVHTRKFEKTGEVRVRKEKLYDIESYAKEMIISRKEHYKPENVAIRERHNKELENWQEQGEKGRIHWTL